MLEKAIKITASADILIIIGTSMQVYPAANLINFVSNTIPIYFIDPNPTISKHKNNNLTVIAEKASTGMQKVVNELVDTLC